MKIHTAQKILAALLVGVSGFAYAKEVATKGVTTLIENIGSNRVKVDIKTYQLDIGRPSDGIPEARENACTYSRYPCSLVQGIDIFVGAAKIFVPRSSFASLSDLSNARLFSKNGAMILVLDGGDASESYSVKLFFNDEHVYRRLLYPSMAGGDPTEETKYKLINTN